MLDECEARGGASRALAHLPAIDDSATERFPAHEAAPHPPRRSWFHVGMLLSGVGVGLLAWALVTLDASPLWSAAEPTALDPGQERAESLSHAFRTAANQVLPTVVKIRSVVRGKRITRSAAPQAENPFEGTPFEDFFRDQPFPPGTQFRQFVPPRQSGGSGVIIDPKGVILTNNHVVAGADEVLVELADGRQLKGTDIRTDEQSDLAIVRVAAAEPLPAAKLGNSDGMEIGDWVLAIGCPFELDSSVSAGIVSGKGRSLPSGKRTDFLQTDAAINPGNSGGPLVNLRGEVVGINTAIASNTGSYQGVGFAIPVNLAKWVTAQLVETGTVRRAYLGVQIAEINAELGDRLGVAPNAGVVVGEVRPGSPAAAAGLQEGDVIVRFADRKVRNPHELQEAVERSPLGSKQTVEFLRGGKTQTVDVRLEALPDEVATSGPSRQTPTDENAGGFTSKELGLEVGALTEAVAKQLGYEAGRGVLVTDVSPDGLAAAAGIREGMVVLRVGKSAVNSVEAFQTALKGESLDTGVLLLIRTPEGNRFVVLRG